MRMTRLFALAAAALPLLAAPIVAQGPLPTPAGPDPRARLPTVRIGALLPLTGPGAWFGKEMRQGLELAITELNPPAPAPPEALARPPATANPAPGGARAPEAPAQAGTSAPAAGPPAIKELTAAAGLQVVLDARDVDALDTQEAAEQFGQLAATAVAAVFTASATPTLAIHPAAAARDILLIHQGLVTSRFPATSRAILHTRPSVASRAEALAAAARAHGVARLALLAAGDEFGKTVRGTIGARWRAWGGTLAHEESLSLDAPDLRTRLRQLARLGLDAVLLGFEGPDLGDLARQLRDAHVTAPILALDQDPSVLLAAGPAFAPAFVLAEVFVPEPSTRAARFSEAYQKKFGSAPSRYAANAYEALAIVLEGLRAARGERRAAPGGTRLRDLLLARRRFPSLYGGHVVLRDEGTFERPLALFTVEREAVVFVRYLEPGARAAGGAIPAARP
jgi:branched-chain amino acid transport system substrate-binding protein